jgi:hypothetical protein
MSPEGRAVFARGLRLSLVATLGLAIEGLRGAELPFLAPLIALSLVAAISGPPSGRLVVVLSGVALGVTAASWLLSAASLSVPGVYGLGVGLLYLWCFVLIFTPKLAPVGILALTMSIVVSALSAASVGLAAGAAVEILLSLITAFGLIYLAQAIFPHPPLSPVAQPAAATVGKMSVVQRSLLATAVLLPLHLFITSEGVATIVVLMTAATMLYQPGLSQSLNWSLASIVGNALGGVAASAAAAITGQHDGQVMAISVVPFVTLAFAAQAAKGPHHEAVFIPGMVTFVLLYGMWLSPLLGGQEVGAMRRVLQVACASAYTVGAASLMLPLVRRLGRRRPA